MAEYNLRIINNYRTEDKAKPTVDHLKDVAKRRFKDAKIGFKVVSHGDMSRDLRSGGNLDNHKADGYIATGGGGHWEEEGKVLEVNHEGKQLSHKYMKRANGVYDRLVSDGEKIHGICEGAKAVAQALGAYSVNSGKMNVDKAQGLNHKYLIPGKHKGKLGNVTLSKEKHQGTHYVMEFDKGNVSGTQYHPEKLDGAKDDASIVRFLEKTTGLKASPVEESSPVESLEGKVEGSPGEPRKKLTREEILKLVSQEAYKRKKAA
jgi:hypothetical protein